MAQKSGCPHRPLPMLRPAKKRSGISPRNAVSPCIPILQGRGFFSSHKKYLQNTAHMKRILTGMMVLLLLLVAVVLVNTFRKGSVQSTYEALPAPQLSDSALARLQRAVQFATISYGDTARFDAATFLAFQQWLRQNYPLMHSRMQLQTIAGYTLWFTLPGSNASLNPIILMAHQDVVPIEESTRSMWTVDPFAGAIKDDFIWGRGTTDDKINLIAQCEAMEQLLAAGFVPQRTIHFIFGHDEEVGGTGAKAVAQLMEAQGIQAELLMDEGGYITREKVPGLQKPVALLGTAEKGYLSLVLTAQVAGGHSSMPEKETSIDILNQALVRLRARPFPARYTEPMQGFMQALGPEMGFVQRMAFANPWLFGPLITKTYEASGPGNAMLHTTLVPTIISAGIKDNVIPTQAVATINLRLLPGDSVAAVLEAVRKVVNDDRIRVEKYQGAIAEPSPVTPVKSFGYQKIDAVVKQSYPQVLSTPFLMIGATDSRHFGRVASNIIKFSPMIDPIGFHGIDERVSLESYKTAIWFYTLLLRE